MAEFAEVMRQANRICVRHEKCNDCPLAHQIDKFTNCDLNLTPCDFTDETILQIEVKVNQWAAENPEPQYPTWREWQQANFPNNSSPIHPCAFIRRSDAHCTDYIGKNSCYDCSNQHIPAEIAERLGIKPKEADHEKC